MRRCGQAHIQPYVFTRPAFGSLHTGMVYLSRIYLKQVSQQLIITICDSNCIQTHDIGLSITTLKSTPACCSHEELGVSGLLTAL